MAFNTQNLIQNIGQYGLSYTSKFDMTIGLPPAMITLASASSDYGFISQMQRLLPFRAINCSAPGVATRMTETNKWGVGPIIKQPYNVAMADLKITFLADSNGIIEAFFHTWLNLTYNFSFSPYSQATFYTRYRDQIVSPLITINKYDRNGATISQYILSKCLPTYFVPTGLDWEETNTLARFTLGLNYQTYDIL